MVAPDAMMPRELPAGGLASFLTSNIDEIDDSVLAFGRAAGINSMRDVAERMAQMGRNGDSFVVHASEREMMVPREVVENNPQLRRQIMESIAAEGADPNAYIVGNEANSINPFTGQREFFLKKLVRGIKNVVKKVAPVVLPVALNVLFPGMGTIASGALGAGIGTLIQGGDIKDALRAGAIGGAIGGLYSGVSGALGGQGFMAGVRQGFTGAPGMGFFELNPSVRSMFGGAAAGGATVPPGTTPAAAAPEGLVGAESVATGGGTAGAAPTPTLAERVRDFVMPRPAMSAEAMAAEATRIAAANPGLDPNTVYSNLVSSQPSALSRFARPALVAGGIAALSGAFSPVPPEEPDTPGYDTTSQELLAANPEAYTVGTPGPTRFARREEIAIPMAEGSTLPAISAQPNVFPPIQIAPIRFAAEGGEMQRFPRRNGYISGPGTETSDDVPAMLSDGEFVMTARAVRGAGNGSRERGVRRMYDMMRMFEGGVAR